MATLTADQIALIRLNVGDGCDKILDYQIEAAYNAAEGDECGTNAIIARWLWMKAAPVSKVLLTGATVDSTAQARLYKERLDYWEACWENGRSTISTGIISLGIDVTPDDLTNPLASWLWGTP